MRKGIYILPNTLTLCSMFLGFYSIISAIKSNYVHAAWAIVIAMIFDGLDGWVARLTHSTTRFGIELDSLSDLIAFGIAPSLVLYRWALIPFGRVGWAASFLFVACGALRLARYNVQMGSAESKSFTGMPIPGAAVIVATLIIFYHEVLEKSPDKNYFILIFTFILAGLMVSTLKFHGAKELNFKTRKPFWILVAFVVIIAIIVIHPETAFFVFAMIYLVGGIIENVVIFYRKKKKAEKEGIS
jgi:CDP-diacylglycerol--serine O-phosphatidyltransferase